MIPNNARPFRITAAAGTELAGASFGGTVWKKGFITLSPSFLLTGVYNPKAFILHAALLRQAFAHCAKFPTAASRRSLARVSVPVWLIVLSDQLPIVALVSHYPTNQLIGHGPSFQRLTEARLCAGQPKTRAYAALSVISRRYSSLEGRSPMCYSPVRHSLGPCGPRTCDLHVLGTPPAFILSQDQTRHPNLSESLSGDSSSICNLPVRRLNGQVRHRFYFNPHL